MTQNTKKCLCSNKMQNISVHSVTLITMFINKNPWQFTSNYVLHSLVHKKKSAFSELVEMEEKPDIISIAKSLRKNVQGVEIVCILTLIPRVKQNVNSLRVLVRHHGAIKPRLIYTLDTELPVGHDTVGRGEDPEVRLQAVGLLGAGDREKV